MASATICVFLVLATVLCVLGHFISPFEAIVPDIIRQEPQSVLGILYRTCHGISLSPGMELTPFQVRNKPQVLWRARKDSYYTFIMVDPDAPSRQNQTLGEFLHWMVGNIPGAEFLRGETLVEYLGSAPGLGSGFHRYTFVLFEQPEMLSFEEQPRLNASSIAGRPNFKTQDFVEKYMLKEPAVGANYYLAQWDPYANEVQAQLGIAD